MYMVVVDCFCGTALSMKANVTGRDACLIYCTRTRARLLRASCSIASGMEPKIEHDLSRHPIYMPGRNSLVSVTAVQYNPTE